jgi:hypothetical protein
MIEMEIKFLMATWTLKIQILPLPRTPIFCLIHATFNSGSTNFLKNMNAYLASPKLL